jgi:CRISPR-associated protein Cas1
MAQYKAYENGQRIEIAKQFIDAKLKNSYIVLKWIADRYPIVADRLKQLRPDMEREWSSLAKAKTVKEIMGVEGGFAQWYWSILSSILDKKWEFESRDFGKTVRPLGAVDPINALLNYGYAILESKCYKALHSNGLDPNVGYLHEINTSKAPLVYDLQEPFRWLVDVAVITGIEKEIFTKKDFIRTENYNIRLRPEGAKKLMAELHWQFTRTTKYRNLNQKWESIIYWKGQEIGQYLIGNRKTLDLSDPRPVLRRDDNEEIRRKILAMTFTEWEKMGYSKGSLFYLKRNAKNDKPFKIYEKVRKKLENKNDKFN